MTALLDTHALVWWMLDPDRLSRRAFNYIKGDGGRLFVSVASIYEIEYKRDRDRSLYQLPRSIPQIVPMLGFEWLRVDAADGFHAAHLDKAHRDPWDRIIAAQAGRRTLDLITSDGPLTEACRNWQVQTVW